MSSSEGHCGREGEILQVSFCWCVEKSHDCEELPLLLAVHPDQRSSRSRPLLCDLTVHFSLSKLVQSVPQMMSVSVDLHVGSPQESDFKTIVRMCFLKVLN